MPVNTKHDAAAARWLRLLEGLETELQVTTLQRAHLNRKRDALRDVVEGLHTLEELKSHFVGDNWEAVRN